MIHKLCHFYTSIHFRKNTKIRGINFETLHKQSRVIYFEKKERKKNVHSLIFEPPSAQVLIFYFPISPPVYANVQIKRRKASFGWSFPMPNSGEKTNEKKKKEKEREKCTSPPILLLEHALQNIATLRYKNPPRRIAAYLSRIRKQRRLNWKISGRDEVLPPSQRFVRAKMEGFVSLEQCKLVPVVLYFPRDDTLFIDTIRTRCSTYTVWRSLMKISSES